MDRRKFLESSLYTLGAFGVGPALASRVSADDRIGIGVIGTGVRGQQLLEFLVAMPQFDVLACCDVLPFRLEEAHAIAGRDASADADYRRMLDDDRIDAVAVATHFSGHHRIVMDALDAGKHIYCEKSMIKGIPETLEVVEFACKRPEQVFQTGFQYHSAPLYRAAAELVASGELGEITAVDCQWNRNGDWRRPLPDPKWERQINWRMYREYSSGLVAELSAHQMDFCNWILDSKVERISGVGGIDYWKDGRETYDNVHVVCRYASGVTATFSSLTTNSLGSYRIAVLGKKGSIQLTTRKGWYSPEVADDPPPGGVDLVSGASVSDGPGGAYWASDSAASYRIDASADDPTPNALNEFADAISRGIAPSSDVVTGAKASIMVQLSLDAMDRDEVMRWQPAYDV